MRIQTLRTGAAYRLALLTALLALAACGQSGSPTETAAAGQSAAPQSWSAPPPSSPPAGTTRPAGLVSFPAPSELLAAGQSRRRVSYIYEDVVKAGEEYDPLLPNNHLTSQAPALSFAPAPAPLTSLADCAFAVYRFTVPDFSGNLVVRSIFDNAPAAGSCWLGAANWGANHWDWSAWDSPAQNLGPSASYQAGDGTFMVVVLFTSGGAKLQTIALGQDVPPLASFTAAPNPVAAGALLGLDASASLDLDTPIATYEWDFENDGAFDLSDTQALASHQYLVAGDYTLVLKVTAVDGGSDTASTSITVTPGAANDPPLAALSANPQTGDAPLNVNFNAAGSTDSDGVIQKYEWDFDGDATYDQDTGAVATTGHIYLAPGIFNATVRVTDDDGATDTAVSTITVTDPGTNTPPVASVKADWFFTDAPLLVQLDASASSDAEGPIAKFEWDWDNNGVYEEDTGSNALASHTFPNPAFYPVKVRVTDSDGNADIAAISLFADDSNLSYDDAEPNNDSPTAQVLPGISIREWDARIGEGTGSDEDVHDWYSLTLEPQQELLLHIDFIHAECDVDMKLYADDGQTVLGSSTSTSDQEQIVYTAASAGTYLVDIYEYTPDPNDATNYTFIARTPQPNDFPVADLQSDTASGPIPLTVNFDSSASYDPGGGSIAKWEWDLDGNGTWDTSSTSSGLETGVYYAVGSFNASVRVTNTIGFTDTASVVITTTGTYDEIEPNNDAAGAQQLSFPLADFNGSLGPGGYDGSNEDWFKISATAGQVLDVTMYLHDDFTDLDMKLYDSDGTTQLDSSTGVGDTENINYTFATSGTFYLKPYVFTSGGAGGYKLDGTLL